MMTFLEVELTNWADRWYLAGISVVTVFVILVVLVFVLQIFNAVAKSAERPKAASKAAPKAAPAASEATKVMPVADASEADKAAVATALYLYMNNVHDEESGILTIAPQHSAWHGTLNPRL